MEVNPSWFRDDVRQVYRAKSIGPNRIVAVFFVGGGCLENSRKPLEFQGILIFETHPFLKCQPPTWWWLSLGRGPTQAISAWFTTTLGDLYTMHNVTIPSYVQAADFAQKLSHLVESQINMRMFRSMVGGKYRMKLMVTIWRWLHKALEVTNVTASIIWWVIYMKIYVKILEKSWIMRENGVKWDI